MLNYDEFINDSEYMEIINAFTFDEVNSVNKLSVTDQMLCILATLVASQGRLEYGHMLKLALDKNVDPALIKEMLYQATAYLGRGRVFDFLKITNDIFEKYHISSFVSLKTTNKDNRFEEGLNKQVSLFGKEMLLRQNDTNTYRKNINRWLATNCFGDYYTRKGLDDRQREIITFCFLLAQGGCENQLKGHIKGNNNVGNNKDVLYNIVEQCMPFIGYPRSLNAMKMIDEVL